MSDTAKGAEIAFKTLEYKDDLLGENDLTRMDHKNENKKRGHKGGNKNRKFNKPRNKAKGNRDNSNRNQKPRDNN